MTKSLSGRLGAKLCSPHSLQHLLDRAFGLRELLYIAGAQHHIRVGPVLRIEKRIAADRDLGIGFGNLTELHTNVALAHVRAHGFREHATPILSLGATSSSIACMIEGTPAITITLPIQKPGAPVTANNSRACIEISPELSPPNSSRQRRTTVALDNTEIDDPVLVAEPPNPTIFTGEDGNDTATHTAAFTHPFTHDCEPLLLGASRRQQISLDEYHRHAAGGVAAARSLSHAIPRATSKATRWTRPGPRSLPRNLTATCSR